MSDLRTPTPRRPAGERGSAYLLVLLLLLVLTVIGLSLAMITQTEVQIGGAERTATRVFYGADAGLRLQLMMSRFAAARPARYELEAVDTGPTPDPVNPGNLWASSQIDVSAFMPAYTGPCNLCSVNQGEDSYWLINYVVNGQARRVTSLGGSDLVQATKLISGMFYIQPERDRRVDEAVRTFDPDKETDDPDVDGLEIIRY